MTASRCRSGFLTNRDFRLLLTAFTLSFLGDYVAIIALSIRTHDLTHSGWAVSAVLLAGIAPMVAIGPAAGWLVDSFETVRVLLLASLLQALLAAALALAPTLALIVLLTLLLGSGEAIASTALFALLPNIVGFPGVPKGNSYLETGRALGAFAGPLLSVSLVTVGGTSVALLVDAATFILVAVGCLFLAVRRHPFLDVTRESAGAAREILAGVRHLLRERQLRLVSIIFSATLLFAGGSVIAVFFAKDVLHAGNLGFGILEGLWAFGYFLGAAMVGRAHVRDRLPFMALIAAQVMGSAVLSAAVVSRLWFATVAFLVAGVGNGAEVVATRSYLQLNAPDAIRGRVLGAFGGMANGMLLVGTVAGGMLVSTVGARSALLVDGAGVLTTASLGFMLYLRASRFANPPE